jgi:hypothetical protein
LAPSHFRVSDILSGRLAIPSEDTVNAQIQKWFREQGVSTCLQGLQNLIVLCSKGLKKFGICVEK